MILATTKSVVDAHKAELENVKLTATAFNNLKSDLDAIFIRQQFDRFQQAMDALILDDAYKTPELVDLLKEISISAKKIDKLNTEQSELQNQIVNITNSVLFYKDGDIKKAIEILATVTDTSIHKHRVLYASYNALIVRATRANNQQEKSEYIQKAKYHAGESYKIGAKVNKSSVTSKVNYATALLRSGNQDDLENALKLLLEAKKDAPLLSVIPYNIAVCHTITKQFNKAFDSLDEAKSRGDFSTENDIQFFMNDPDFNDLRNAAASNPIYQERLNKLLKISQ